MIAITLGQTAMAPGQDSSHSWDYWWRDLSYFGDNFTLIDNFGFLPPSYLSNFPPCNGGTFLMYADGQWLQSVGVEVSLGLPWNSVKDIAITELLYDGSRNCASLTVNGFVDTCVTAAADNMPHHIAISGAKRGVINLGNGDNTVTVDYLSNEYTWSNNFKIAAGDGNDTIVVQPETFSEMAGATPIPWGLAPFYGSSGSSTPLPVGWTFNTAPDKTTADIALGSGNNQLELQECSGTITAGSGDSNILLVDGHDNLTLGSGTAIVTIAAYDTAVPASFALATDRGSDLVQIGSGHADISVDDTMTFMTPLTTVTITHGQAGDNTADGPDDIRYGHGSGSNFVGGDWSALTVDLVGYSAGSSATLTPAGDHTELTIQDAAGGPADVVNLYGAPLSGIAALHLLFT